MFESKFTLIDGVLRTQEGLLPVIGVDAKGYNYVSLSNKRVFVHRVVFFLANGYLPDFIDHKDGNKNNNSASNLREATVSENNRNVGIRRDNKSGYKGVTWNKSAKKWHAQIKFNKKNNYIGLFKDSVDAAIAYDKKAIELHGEFAMTNKSMMRY